MVSCSQEQFVFVALAVGMSLLAGTAGADLLPHITYTIDSPTSDVTIDTEADVQLSLDADTSTVVGSSEDMGQLSGSVVAAFGPSPTVGPGRIYFRSGSLMLGALQSNVTFSVPLTAVTGDVEAGTRDISLVLDTTAGIPFANTVQTEPGVYSFGPINMVMAVDRSVDWNVDEQGGQAAVLSGTEAAFDDLFVTVAASGTVVPMGDNAHDLYLAFTSSEVTTLNVTDSAFLVSQGMNLDIDGDFSVTAVDVDMLSESNLESVIPVPEPAAWALELAALATIGVFTRSRRR